MTVKELIEKLEKMPQDLPVYTYEIGEDPSCSGFKIEDVQPCIDFLPIDVVLLVNKRGYKI